MCESDRERERVREMEKSILAKLVRKRLTKWEWKPDKEKERVEECLIKRVTECENDS